MIHYKAYNSCTPWIKHEINTLLQKLDWWQKKDHEERRQTCSSQFLICFNNDGEAELVTDTKKLRKANYQIH